jgi:branched-chain amino acid transport system substrate-binding protein
VCGNDCDDTFLPAGPLLVCDQLPDSNPVKRGALVYRHAYDTAYGAGTVSTIGGNAWDAGLLLERAIPLALKEGQPGSKAFREALRSALEGTADLHTSQGVVNMTPADHSGLDEHAGVMVQIMNSTWRLAAD